jgi:hypothetical protein
MTDTGPADADLPDRDSAVNRALDAAINAMCAATSDFAKFAAIRYRRPNHHHSRWRQPGARQHLLLDAEIDGAEGPLHSP